MKSLRYYKNTIFSWLGIRQCDNCGDVTGLKVAYSQDEDYAKVYLCKKCYPLLVDDCEELSIR